MHTLWPACYNAGCGVLLKYVCIIFWIQILSAYHDIWGGKDLLFALKSKCINQFWNNYYTILTNCNCTNMSKGWFVTIFFFMKCSFSRFHISWDGKVGSLTFYFTSFLLINNDHQIRICLVKMKYNSRFDVCQYN